MLDEELTMTEEEVFSLVRDNYHRVNQDYLKEQVKVALSVPLMSKEETLDGLLNWVTIGGCGGMNGYYRKFVLSAIGHLLS